MSRGLDILSAVPDPLKVFKGWLGENLSRFFTFPVGTIPCAPVYFAYPQFGRSEWTLSYIAIQGWGLV